MRAGPLTRVAEGEDLPQHRVQFLRGHLLRLLATRLARRSAEPLNIGHIARHLLTLATWQLSKKLAKDAEFALAITTRATARTRLLFCLVHLMMQVRDRRLAEVVARLAEKRVQEVVTAKGSSDQRRDILAGMCADAHGVANMAEDLVVTHGNESELAEVAVSREVLECVECGAEQTE